MILRLQTSGWPKPKNEAYQNHIAEPLMLWPLKFLRDKAMIQNAIPGLQVLWSTNLFMEGYLSMVVKMEEECLV